MYQVACQFFGSVFWIMVMSLGQDSVGVAFAHTTLQQRLAVEAFIGLVGWEAALVRLGPVFLYVYNGVERNSAAPHWNSRWQPADAGQHVNCMGAAGWCWSQGSWEGSP